MFVKFHTYRCLDGVGVIYKKTRRSKILNSINFMEFIYIYLCFEFEVFS